MATRNRHPSRVFQPATYIGLSRELSRIWQLEDRIVGSKLGLTPTQVHALADLWQHPALPMSELAEHLQITRSTATRIVDVLVKKGLVARTVSREDRRRQEVELTNKGEEQYLDLESHLRSIAQRVIRDTGPEASRLMESLASLLEVEREIAKRESSSNPPS